MITKFLSRDQELTSLPLEIAINSAASSLSSLTPSPSDHLENQMTTKDDKTNIENDNNNAYDSNYDSDLFMALYER